MAAVLVVLGLLLLAGCSGGSEEASCGTAPAGFAHGEAEVGDARLHYVIGGSGPPVVLLHGFPQTWQFWRGTASRLAAEHTVIVPDLRGVGCSSVEPGGYDKQTMAADVHGLVRGLGFEQAAVVGHDLGGWVAFAYARTYPEQVSHLVIGGAVLPGFGGDRLLDFTEPGRGAWHLVFFQQPEVPEALIGGREREFLTGFVGSPLVRESEEFADAVAAYSRPGRLTAALGQYRALHLDAADNLRGLREPLSMPTLALEGGTEGGRSADSLRRVARDVTVMSIPDAGHYAAQERPAAFADRLRAFLDEAGS